MNAKLAQGSQPDKRAIGVLVAIVMAAGTLTGCSSAVLPSAVGGAHGRPAAGSVTLREAELDPPVLVDGVTLSLVSDSGGTVPAAGDTVSMLFDGKSTVWALYTSNNGDLSFSGTYSYSGSRMTLQFSANGFTHHASFSLALDQSTVTLPFHVLSGSPGTSRWVVSPVDPVAAGVAVAMATVSSTTSGVTPADLVEAAADYVSAATGAPISEGPQFTALVAADREIRPAAHRALPALASFVSHVGPASYILTGRYTATGQKVHASTPDRSAMAKFNPLVDGITELPDGIDLQNYYGATVTVAFLGSTDTPGSAGEQLTPDGTFSNVLNINKSVRSPHNSISDPPSKTALFFLPFQGPSPGRSLQYTWELSRGRITSVGVQQFYDPNIAQEESALEGDGYAAPQLLTGTAASVFALIKALKKDPGVVYYNSHGGPDGTVLTGDFLGNTLDAALAAWAKLVGKLRKLGAPKSAFALGSPLDAGTPTRNAYYFALNPVFWQWLHNRQHVDLTHSLVYLDACDADANPLLATYVGARAFFAYDVDVADPLGNAVALYLFTMLTKKSFTAEEAYYNMLLIDETGQTVYSNDNDFNEVFAPEQRTLAKAAQENAEERAREKMGPEPNQPKSDIYNVLDAYGTQTYGDTVPYVGSGWLSDNVSGGAVFYLLVAARAPSLGGTIKQGLRNLTTCWNAWWSKGKLGGISTTCDQAAPGYAPNADEYWYARYLLTGKHQGFSDEYIPRFTLNDGS
jgi:hypothetical protein